MCRWQLDQPITSTSSYCSFSILCAPQGSIVYPGSLSPTCSLCGVSLNLATTALDLQSSEPLGMPVQGLDEVYSLLLDETGTNLVYIYFSQTKCLGSQWCVCGSSINRVYMSCPTPWKGLGNDSVSVNVCSHCICPGGGLQWAGFGGEPHLCPMEGSLYIVNSKTGCKPFPKDECVKFQWAQPCHLLITPRIVGSLTIL